MAALDCVPVKLRTLPLDLHLECGVYSKKPDISADAEPEYSLLCENKTITQELVDRLKRTIFPESKVYIPRKYVVEKLFDKGIFLEFNEDDVKAIRALENPWEAKKKPAVDLAAAEKKVTAPAPALEVKPIQSSAKILKDNDRAKIVQNKIKAQKFREVMKVYDRTKEITESMLSSAAETGKIDKEQSAEITKDIQNQIDKTDVSLIIRTINQIRTVDEYLHTHCLNVAYLNGLIGKWLDYDKVRQNEVVETGLFHDLGKLGIPPEIIHKVDDLSPEELVEMKRHPVLSLEMLMKSGVRNKAVLEGVIQHHERVNGTGYPKGLVAGDICEYARITAISDTYDAMVTKRVHADSHSPFVILNEFEKGGYSELDIKYVNVFISCMVEELKGKEIVMNDGREAIVLLVNPSRLLYPIVDIDGEVLMTNDDFYCVRMKNILG